MGIINFAPQFAEAVEYGRKTSTVRRREGRNWAKNIHFRLGLYTGHRSRDQRYLGSGLVQAVHDVVIDRGSVIQNGERLAKLLPFAQAEGFDTFAQFEQWIADHYGLPFEGVRVEWRLVGPGDWRWKATQAALEAMVVPYCDWRQDADGVWLSPGDDPLLLDAWRALGWPDPYLATSAEVTPDDQPEPLTAAACQVPPPDRSDVAARLIQKIGEVAEAKSFGAAGSTVLEHAGAVVLHLLQHPDQIDRFMREGGRILFHDEATRTPAEIERALEAAQPQPQPGDIPCNL